jgi:predicted nucleotidyltransferase
MPGRRNGNEDRARLQLAQEAARLIVEHGIRDYRVAKVKAAERLGINSRGSLPGNAEVESAVQSHLSLFGGESHADHLCLLRESALTAMELLAAFSPRLVGPVLQGTADHNSAVNLHVFTDSPESIAFQLNADGFDCRPYERRLKISRGKAAKAETFVGYEFELEDAAIQATVFPVDGIRQAPISPIDGRPMKRADQKAVASLLSDSR